MLNMFPPSTDDLTWMQQCPFKDLPPEDVALFFVEPGRSIDPAVLAVARTCPVREKEVAWAYDQERPAGYFGGLSPAQRKRMTKEEAIAFVIADREQALAERAGKTQPARGGTRPADCTDCGCSATKRHTAHARPA